MVRLPLDNDDRSLPVGTDADAAQGKTGRVVANVDDHVGQSTRRSPRAREWSVPKRSRLGTPVRGRTHSHRSASLPSIPGDGR